MFYHQQTQALSISHIWCPPSRRTTSGRMSGEHTSSCPCRSNWPPCRSRRRPPSRSCTPPARHSSACRHHVRRPRPRHFTSALKMKPHWRPRRWQTAPWTPSAWWISLLESSALQSIHLHEEGLDLGVVVRPEQSRGAISIHLHGAVAWWTGREGEVLNLGPWRRW